MLEKITLVVVPALLTAIGFIIKRKIEQKKSMEQIDKHDRLLDLRNKLIASGTTINDLNAFERQVLGRVDAAQTLADAIKDQAIIVYTSDDDNLTQLEITQRASDAYRKSDEKLNEIVGSLIGVLSSEDSDLLMRAHQDWMRYRDAHAVFEANQFKHGSIQSLVHINALASTTIARIIELEPILRDVESK